MADLFTLVELAAYAQRDIDNATAELLRDLVTTEIRDAVGGTAWDAMSDPDRARFKGIALEVAKRALLNPEGVREQSHSIDDFTTAKTYAMETFGGVELTASEQARIDKILGRSQGAFTVRPYGEPDCPPWRRTSAYHPC